MVAVFGCLMLVQSVAASWAAAAMPQRDIFGNPLCVSESAHPSQTTDHDPRAACCMLGCNLVASAVPAPDLFSTTVDWPAFLLDWMPQPATATALIRPDERPGRPRDPPRAFR